MKIFYSGRQTGRTTKLIQLAAESEARGETCYIVCHNHRTAHFVAARAREMNLVIGFPLTFDEFLKGSYAGENITKFYIDNAEFLFGMLSRGVPIEAITITKEEDVDETVV